MGACCGGTRRPDFIVVSFNGEAKKLTPVPSSVELLTEQVFYAFPQLDEHALSLKTHRRPITNNADFKSELQSSKVVTFIITYSEPVAAPIDLSGDCFVIQNEGITHLGFLTNLNLLMTTSKVLSSIESVKKATCECQLDSTVFFYRSPTLSVTLTGVKSAVSAEILPLVSKILRPQDAVLISNSEVTLLSVDPYVLTYKGDFMPGCPILCNGRVVGMHMSKNSGVNIQAVINELQSVSTVHTFSDRINELLTQVVFHDDVPSPTARFNYLYSLTPTGILSFNAAKQVFTHFQLDLPENPSIAQGKAGVYITGGLSAAAMTNLTYYFDSYTMSISSKQGMITARQGHALACSSTELFAISGSTESGLTNECEVFEMKKNLWKPIYPLHISRAHASTCWFQGSLYVAGGIQGDGHYCHVIEKYTENQWSKLGITSPESISNVKLVTDRNSLFLLGSSLWKFNEDSFDRVTETNADLPGTHVVCHQSRFYSFVDPDTILWTEADTWQTIKNQ